MQMVYNKKILFGPLQLFISCWRKTNKRQSSFFTTIVTSKNDGIQFVILTQKIASKMLTMNEKSVEDFEKNKSSRNWETQFPERQKEWKKKRNTEMRVSYKARKKLILKMVARCDMMWQIRKKKQFAKVSRWISLKRLKSKDSEINITSKMLM